SPRVTMGAPPPNPRRDSSLTAPFGVTMGAPPRGMMGALPRGLDGGSAPKPPPGGDAAPLGRLPGEWAKVGTAAGHAGPRTRYPTGAGRQTFRRRGATRCGVRRSQARCRGITLPGNPGIPSPSTMSPFQLAPRLVALVLAGPIG